MSLAKWISAELKVPRSLVDEALGKAHAQVKRFRIKKRAGGDRLIQQPAAKLKMLQYWVIVNICDHLPISQAAYAYRPGVSTLDNARHHKGNRYFLKLDLKDFFPCVLASDFLPIVSRWHSDTNPEWPLSETDEELLRLACFDSQGRLPIGYPSSPAISNVVMYQFDKDTEALIADPRFGDVKYSRYADDLVFSTNKKGACVELLPRIKELIDITKRPDISINPKKTRISSASGGGALVTGLRISGTGHISMHRNQKDHIRLLLGLMRKNILADEDIQSLKGHLAYAKHVDPLFYSRVQLKYFREIGVLQNRIGQADAGLSG